MNLTCVLICCHVVVVYVYVKMTFTASSGRLLHLSNAISQQTEDVSHSSSDSFVKYDWCSFSQVLMLGLIMQKGCSPSHCISHTKPVIQLV